MTNNLTKEPSSLAYALFITVSFILSMLLSYYLSDLKFVHFEMQNLFGFFLFTFLGVGVFLLGRSYQKSFKHMIPIVLLIWLMGVLFLIFGLDWKFLRRN